MSQTRWVDTKIILIHEQDKQDALEGGGSPWKTAPDEVSAAEVQTFFLPRPRPQLRPCDLAGKQKKLSKTG